MTLAIEGHRLFAEGSLERTRTGVAASLGCNGDHEGCWSNRVGTSFFQPRAVLRGISCASAPTRKAQVLIISPAEGTIGGDDACGCLVTSFVQHKGP